MKATPASALIRLFLGLLLNSVLLSLTACEREPVKPEVDEVHTVQSGNVGEDSTQVTPMPEPAQTLF